MRPFVIVFTILLIVAFSCKRDGMHVDQDASEQERLFFKDYKPPEFKWGYLNRDGELIIKNQYDAARDFSEGLAAVSFQGKWGYINKDGEVVIPFKFRSAGAFSCKRALVQDFEYRQFYIDPNGNEKFREEEVELNPYADCKARITKNGNHYFIDENGEIISDTAFLSATNYHDGYAVVEDLAGFNIIDKTGKRVFEQSYDRCYSPSDQMVRLQENGKTKYVSLSGQQMSDSFSNGTDFHNGSTAIERGSWKLINKEGKIISQGYDQLVYAGDDCWIYYQNGKCGLISTEGKELTPALYDIIYRFNDGVSAYSEGDFWGVITSEGREITPALFPLMWEFKNGMARAIFNGGVGFINRNGEQVIPPTYIEVRDYSEGLARVQVIK